MAKVSFFGPLTWVKPFGQNAMMPGDEHPWWAGDFPDGSLVFQVSAHPNKDAELQTLEVVRLSTEYHRQGAPFVTFAVRNAGSSAVFSYRIFISGVGF